MKQTPDQPPSGYDGHRTLKAFALALLLLVILEGVFRMVAPHLSGNLTHIREFSELRSTIMDRPGSAAVFIGNSLTANGIEATYYSELAAGYSGHAVRAVKFVPDGTTLLDWRCIVDQLPRARTGDPLIIGFAWDQVADQQTVNISYTFGLLCPLGMLPQASRVHAIGIGGWIEAAVAKLSMIYVLRERIRNGILGLIVPHYEIELQRMNDRTRDAPGGKPNPGSSKTYDSLVFLLENARKLGYRPVLIAMPTAQQYQVDSRLTSLLRDRNVQFLDMRNESWLRSDLFLDSIHLSPDGSQLLTRSLAQSIYGYSATGHSAGLSSLAR